MCWQISVRLPYNKFHENPLVLLELLHADRYGNANRCILPLFIGNMPKRMNCNGEMGQDQDKWIILIPAGWVRDFGDIHKETASHYTQSYLANWLVNNHWSPAIIKGEYGQKHQAPNSRDWWRNTRYLWSNSLEYIDIPKVFFIPNHAGHCCTNVIQGHCCTTMLQQPLDMWVVYLLGKTQQIDRHAWALEVFFTHVKLWRTPKSITSS
jgi:hypothetical protein